MELKFVEKNLLVTRDGYNGLVNVYTVYDLSKIQAGDEWQLGKFTSHSYETVFILSKAKYFVGMEPMSRYTLIVRDLNKYPIEAKVVSMGSNLSYCGPVGYILGSRVEECNRIYFSTWKSDKGVDNMLMNVFEDCEPYQQATTVAMNLDFRCHQVNLRYV